MKIDEREQELSTADIAAGERQSRRPTSTTELAQDLKTAEPVRQTMNTTLFPENDAQGYRTRWTEIQSGFVDEPRRAVEQADGLVAEVIKRLAQSFADERARLEGQWGRGDNVNTEDLRLALQRYRSFFDRLLNV